MIYFAYGSNMSSQRLKERTPSATSIGPAYLPGYALRVHKQGQDGSGKCNIVQTGCEDDVVYGVLYSLSEDDLRILDRIEGAGIHYRRSIIGVQGEKNPVSANCYFAIKMKIDDSLVPFDWYMRHVLIGAREHGLPYHYLQQLLSIPTVIDPSRQS